MGKSADADVVKLATAVQALACEAFPAQTWVQLVARLSPEERSQLGGGDDKCLRTRLSGQFGAKARRGPNGTTVNVVLRHCLPAVDERDREQKSAEIIGLFRAVHGPEAPLAEVSLPRPRQGGLGAQLQQQRDENAALAAENRQLAHDNAVLVAELKAVKARLRALEAQFAAVRIPAPARTVGINPSGDDGFARAKLVRPYTQARPSTRAPAHAAEEEQDEESEPDDSAPARRYTRDRTFTDDTGETPPAAAKTNVHREANIPRIFRPSPGSLPHSPPLLPPDLEPVTPPARGPGHEPRPRFAGRAVMPPGVKVPVPRQDRSASVVWGVPTTPTLFLDLTVAPRTGVVDEPGTDSDRARRAARAEAARLVAGLRHAVRDVWVDGWADLPVEQTPAGRGRAQLPLLAVAFVLAALMAAVSTLLS